MRPWIRRIYTKRLAIHKHDALTLHTRRLIVECMKLLLLITMLGLAACGTVVGVTSDTVDVGTDVVGVVF